MQVFQKIPISILSTLKHLILELIYNMIAYSLALAALASTVTVTCVSSTNTNTNTNTNAKLSKVIQRQLDTGARVYVESDTGRQMIFHGVNTVVKGYPWVPLTTEFDIDISLNENDHINLSNLGVNIYRLGSMWPGIEPNEGEYNATYIDSLRIITREASNYGIYTILDMHQDVLSEKYCGEGIPAWAAITDDITFPSPLDETYTDKSNIDGFPTRQDCSKYNWPKYYNTYNAGLAFQNLYTNVNNVRDAWGKMWIHLATELGSVEDSILAYELINEPWSGDNMNNPKLFIPSVADKTYLQPTYDSLANDIRTIDNTTLIMFAAVTWDDVVPCGFEHPPGGDEYASQSVFAYHYYNKPQFLPKIYFHQRNADAERLQVGQILTEFERSNVDEDMTDDLYVEVANYADKYLLSWTNWEYKTFCKENEESINSDSQAAAYGSCKTGYGSHNWLYNDNGSIISDTAKKLARTYTQYTAGNIINMIFDPITSDYEFIYEHNVDIKEPTIIYANKQYNYPNGVLIDIIPNILDYTNTNGSENHYEFVMNTNRMKKFNFKNGEKIKIKMTAK